jgi:hypothetical protein
MSLLKYRSPIGHTNMTKVQFPKQLIIETASTGILQKVSFGASELAKDYITNCGKYWSALATTPAETSAEAKEAFTFTNRSSS